MQINAVQERRWAGAWHGTQGRARIAFFRAHRLGERHSHGFAS
jgi:hypothetical protein